MAQQKLGSAMGVQVMGDFLFRKAAFTRPANAETMFSHAQYRPLFCCSGIDDF
jgi:hypothetical protein